MTVTKKLLIGCGLGCGTLVLVAIISAVSFAVWVARPGELLEPERLLGANTRGYFEWRLALEDPGTEGFAELLIESLKKLPPELEEPMPPWLSRWAQDHAGPASSHVVRRGAVKPFPAVFASVLHCSCRALGVRLRTAQR